MKISTREFLTSLFFSMGFRYLARDCDGTLYAYFGKPEQSLKNTTGWGYNARFNVDVATQFYLDIPGASLLDLKEELEEIIHRRDSYK